MSIRNKDVNKCVEGSLVSSVDADDFDQIRHYLTPQLAFRIIK